MQEENGERLGRRCVICGQDCWKVLRPAKRVSAIQCQSCNHVELEIFSKKPKEVIWKNTN
jgi:hypothetical protein